MNSNKEKVSYCIGLEAGTNIRNQFNDIDPEKLKKGFEDGIEDNPLALENEEVKKILTTLQKQIQEQQKVFVEQIAEKNQEEGQKFLQNNKEKDGVEVLSSGLQYKILESGTGKNPSINDIVSVHYRGTLLDGTVFDSTYERDQPQEFPVNRVIPGWSEALKKMRVGDKWRIFIPPYLAYGENGYGPKIQPNATLVFEMELLKIN